MAKQKTETTGPAEKPPVLDLRGVSVIVSDGGAEAPGLILHGQSAPGSIYPESGNGVAIAVLPYNNLAGLAARVSVAVAGRSVMHRDDPKRIRRQTHADGSKSFTYTRQTEAMLHLALACEPRELPGMVALLAGLGGPLDPTNAIGGAASE